MTEYEVTGISDNIGRGLPREEAKAAARQFKYTKGTVPFVYSSLLYSRYSFYSFIPHAT